MNGSGSGPAYTVEARVGDGAAPTEINGRILDQQWRHVAFALVPDGIGVPSRHLSLVATENGFMSYEAAMALAWWYVAAAKWMAVEARIVEHEFAWSYSAERRAEGETLSTVNRRIEQPGRSS